MIMNYTLRSEPLFSIILCTTPPYPSRYNSVFLRKIITLAALLLVIRRR